MIAIISVQYLIYFNFMFSAPNNLCFIHYCICNHKQRAYTVDVF